MTTPLKHYALTRLGMKDEQRTYFRRDASCPVITHVRRRKEDTRSQVPAWLVNISEEGCLITSDHFPGRVEDCYVIVPGLGAKLFGIVKNQGQYTINIVFSTKLTPQVVDSVARLTLSHKDP